MSVNGAERFIILLQVNMDLNVLPMAYTSTFSFEVSRCIFLLNLFSPGKYFGIFKCVQILARSNSIFVVKTS